MALIVSVSGVRGIVGTELTPEIALRYAATFGTLLGGGRVAVGRDSRPSGSALGQAVMSGLAGAGCAVDDLGIVPTPTIGLLVRERGCMGGIHVTASHNPSPYNGLKLFAADGAVLPADAGKALQDRFLANQWSWANWSGCGATVAATDAWIRHRDRVSELVDVPAIRKAKFKIVLDANGGAGGPLGLSLLELFGCTVIPVACVPDGQFRHEPEPLPAHLGDIENKVKQHSGAIGAALDPDADRLVLIDESGRCLSEELTLALAVQQRLTQERGPVVINLSTSCTTEDIAKAAGVPCYRAAVGEANVVARMRAEKALVGGEGNGGVIDPRVGGVRDPFIGLGLILGRMAATGQTLQQLAEALPHYVMRKDKVTLPREKLESAFAILKARWPDAVVDQTDGLRLSWPDRWLHVRGSNTEPIVRVIAEAHDLAALQALLSQSIQSLQSV